MAARQSGRTAAHQPACPLQHAGQPRDGGRRAPGRGRCMRLRAGGAWPKREHTTGSPRARPSRIPPRPCTRRARSDPSARFDPALPQTAL